MIPQCFVSFFRISVLSILVGISCSHERVGSIPTPTSDGLLRMVQDLEHCFTNALEKKKRSLIRVRHEVLPVFYIMESIFLKHLVRMQDLQMQVQDLPNLQITSDRTCKKRKQARVER